jgi:hypothetical protein
MIMPGMAVMDVTGFELATSYLQMKDYVCENLGLMN